MNKYGSGWFVPTFGESIDSIVLSDDVLPSFTREDGGGYL